MPGWSPVASAVIMMRVSQLLVDDELLGQLAGNLIAIGEHRLDGQVRAQLGERALEELREFGGASKAIAACDPGRVGAEARHEMVEVVRIECRHMVSDYLTRVTGLVSLGRRSVRVDGVVS